jgi:hypothetical protein
MGVILFLVAQIVIVVLFPVGFIAGVVKSFYNHHFNTGLRNLDAKFLTLAKSIDKYGNVVCAELFDWALITKEAKVKFGRIEQTISAVIGHNEKAGTLTKTGKILVKVLNWIDPNHTQDAARDDKYCNNPIS